jgi:hypothetical protein
MHATRGGQSLATVCISQKIAAKSGTRRIKLTVTKRPITEKMTTVIRSGFSIVPATPDQPVSANIADRSADFKGKSVMTTPLGLNMPTVANVLVRGSDREHKNDFLRPPPADH